MKKILGLISFLSIIAILYFGGKIALKEYFNEFYYYAPNLVGKDITPTLAAAKKLPIKILEAEREFSPLPAGEIFMQEPSAGKVIKRGRIIKVWVSKGSADIVVPDVKGLQVNDANSILSSRGFNVGNISTVSLPLLEGEVVSTDPAIGNSALRGSTISLLVNKRNSISKIRMPDLIGLTLEEAKQELQNNSLVLGKISSVDFPGLEPNIVVETSTDPNSSISTGSLVDIQISK